MRIVTAAAMAAALLIGSAGPAQVAVVTADFTIDLSTDQLFHSAVSDDRWRWEAVIPPLAAPADSTLDLTVTFDGGVLRLIEGDTPPDTAQLVHRSLLLTKQSELRDALAAVEFEIASKTTLLEAKRAMREAKQAELQQTEADLQMVEADLVTIQQEVDNARADRDFYSASKAAKELELEDILADIADFIGDLFSAAYKALTEARDKLVDEITMLASQLFDAEQRLIQATASYDEKEEERQSLTSSSVSLGNDVSTLDSQIAELEQQLAEAMAERMQLLAVLLVIDQQLIQMALPADAEWLQIVLKAANGSPVPVSGTALLNVVNGDPVFDAPVFQGTVDGLSQLTVYADMTESFIDLAGFRLIIDLDGEPGDLLPIDYLQLSLFAEEVSILFKDGPISVGDGTAQMPSQGIAVPAPPTLAMLAAALAGLGRLGRHRRRSGSEAGAALRS